MASEPYGLVEVTDRYLRMDGETPAHADQPLSGGQVVAVTADGAGELERVDNRVVDGIEGWTIEGEAIDGDAVSAYGTVYDKNRVEIRFKLELPEDEATALVDSVLASWKWKI